MKCPKCEEGKVTKVRLKISGDEAALCDYCETLWLEGEEIKVNTGHPFDIARQDEDIEYAIDENENEDQEHRAARYHDYK